jgi:hypothetical protein
MFYDQLAHGGDEFWWDYQAGCLAGSPCFEELLILDVSNFARTGRANLRYALDMNAAVADQFTIYMRGEFGDSK